VADYIEPKRKHITPEFLSSLDGLDLDGKVYAVLMGTLNHLASKGKSVDPEALELKKELEHAE
jgi:HD superfamily phosphohydrolase YqeK